MRICMLSYHCSPFSLLGGDGAGGMNVYLKELNSALSENHSAAVDVFARSPGEKHTGITPVNDAVRIIHLPAGPENPVSRNTLFHGVTEFSVRLQEFISKNRSYDVLYSHYWLSGLIGESVKKSWGIPHVFNFHTLEFLKEQALNNPSLFCRILAERSLAEATDAIISSSFEEKEHLLEEYGLPESKISVIYPGVNNRIFYPERRKEADREIGREEAEHIYLYAGRIEPIKGLNNLIEAWDLLKRKHPRIYNKSRLVIIGGGRKEQDFEKNPEMQRLQSLIHEKSLQERILFLGSRRQDELRHYYTAADALVLPSLYESFGLVVVEALACGTPVIVSRIGKIKSIVEDGKNGFSFSPNNPGALAAALEEFPKRRSRLFPRERIRSDIVEKFSWALTAAETYSVISGLVRSRENITTKSLPGESLRPA